MRCILLSAASTSLLSKFSTPKATTHAAVHYCRLNTSASTNFKFKSDTACCTRTQPHINQTRDADSLMKIVYGTFNVLFFPSFEPILSSHTPVLHLTP